MKAHSGVRCSVLFFICFTIFPTSVRADENCASFGRAYGQRQAQRYCQLIDSGGHAARYGARACDLSLARACRESFLSTIMEDHQCLRIAGTEFYEFMYLACIGDNTTQGACTIDDHYRFSAAGGCFDESVGLVFSSPAETRLNWYGAVDRCEGLTEGDYFDWRLPSKDELRSVSGPVYRDHMKNPSADLIDDNVFGPSSEYSFWAEDGPPHPDYKYVVAMICRDSSLWPDGGCSDGNTVKTYDYNVVCVRNEN